MESLHQLHQLTNCTNCTNWCILKSLHQLKLYSLQRRRERYTIIYIWKITQHMVPNIDGRMGTQLNHKTSKTWNTVHYSVSNKQKHDTIPSRECNNKMYLGLGCTTRCQNIWETSKVLKLKNSNLSSTSFWSSFLISQKCPTVSPHQEAIASSTSSLIWGLKEITKMVESSTRPWSSLSCFEATPSIQVSKDMWYYATCFKKIMWNHWYMWSFQLRVGVGQQ